MNYVIHEKPCAQRLLNAAWLFKGEVFTRMVLMNDANDVFGRDVSHHKKCLGNYFATSNSMMETITENYNKEQDII